MDIKAIHERVQDIRSKYPGTIKILKKRLKNETKDEGSDLEQIVDENLRWFVKAATDAYIGNRGIKELIEWANKKESINNFCSFIQSQLKKDWVRLKYFDPNLATKTTIAVSETTSVQTQSGLTDKEIDDFSSANDDDSDTSKLIRVDSLVSEASKIAIKNLAKTNKLKQSEMAGKILELGLRYYK